MGEMRRCVIALSKFINTLSVSPNTKRALSTTVIARDCFNIQDSADFEKKVIESPIPVVVDFHATWCGPCKILGPRLENVIAMKADKVHLAKVDIDDHAELAMKYDVTAVPSVIGLKGGKTVNRFVGVVDDDQIESFVEKLIN